MDAQDLIDRLINGDPQQQAARQAALLRGQQQFGQTMQGASQQGHGLDLLNFVAQNSNNAPLAQGVQGIQQAQAAQYTPVKMDKGAYIPGTGQYMESPGVADEKEADRTNKRLLYATQLQAHDDATQARAEAAAAATDQRRIAAQAATDQRAEAALLRRSVVGGLTAAQQDRSDMAHQRLEYRQEQDNQNDTSKFGVMLTKNGLPQIAGAVNDIRQMLDNTPKGKLAGVGYGQASLSKIPFVSDMTVGEDGKANRASIQRLINAMTLTEAGKAVTKNEEVRQAIANMASDSYSENDFRNAMEKTILPAIENVRSNAIRQTDPSIVDRYMKNDPTGFDPRQSFLKGSRTTTPTAVTQEIQRNPSGPARGAAPTVMHFDAQGKLVQ